MIRAGAFLLAATFAPLAQAQTAPAPPAARAPVSAEARALSREIALLVNPPQTMTDYFRADAYRLQLRAGLAAAPGLAQLEQEHPGILDAVLRRIQPLLADEMAKIVPDMIDRIAAIYAARLTMPELRETLAFYRSPLGRRMIASVNAQAFKQGVDIGVKSASEGSEITARQVQSGVATAGMTVFGELTAAERTDILRFSTSPTGRKLNLLTPAVSATVAAWINEPRPEVQARINDAMLQEAGAFIANEKKP